MERATDEMVLIQSVKKLNLDHSREEDRQRRHRIIGAARASGLRGGVTTSSSSSSASSSSSTTTAKASSPASSSSSAFTSTFSTSASPSSHNTSTASPGSSGGGGRHLSAAMFGLYRNTPKTLKDVRNMRAAAREQQRRSARQDALNTKRDDLDISTSPSSASAPSSTSASSSSLATAGGARLGSATSAKTHAKTSATTRTSACCLGDIKACLEQAVLQPLNSSLPLGSSPGTPPPTTSTPRTTPVTTPPPPAPSPSSPARTGGKGMDTSATETSNNPAATTSGSQAVGQPRAIAGNAYTNLKVEQEVNATLLAEVQGIQNKLAAAAGDPDEMMKHLKALRLLTCRPGEPPIATMLAANTPLYLMEVLGVSPAHAKEAAWALSNLAAGTPEQTSQLLDAGAGRILTTLLADDNEELAHTAVWGLANMAGDGPHVRDQVLECGVLPRLISLLEGILPPDTTAMNTASQTGTAMSASRALTMAASGTSSTTSTSSSSPASSGTASMVSSITSTTGSSGGGVGGGDTSATAQLQLQHLQLHGHQQQQQQQQMQQRRMWMDASVWWQQPSLAVPFEPHLQNNDNLSFDAALERAYAAHVKDGSRSSMSSIGGLGSQMDGGGDDEGIGAGGGRSMAEGSDTTTTTATTSTITTMSTSTTATPTLNGSFGTRVGGSVSTLATPAVVVSRTTRERICTLVWCLLNLCRGKPRPSFEAVVPCAPVLLRVLRTLGTHMHMSAATVDAAWALAYMSEDATALPDLIALGAVPTMLSLLRQCTPRQALFRPLIRFIGNVTIGESDVTTLLLKQGVVDVLAYFSNSSLHWLSREALWALSNLAASDEHHVRLMATKGVHEAVLGLILSERLVPAQMKEAQFVLKNMVAIGASQDAARIQHTAAGLGVTIEEE